VLAAIDGARIVHIAAHGQHQRDSPLFSSIRLADGRSSATTSIGYRACSRPYCLRPGRQPTGLGTGAGPYQGCCWRHPQSFPVSQRSPRSAADLWPTTIGWRRLGSRVRARGRALTAAGSRNRSLFRLGW
jgi:hypothetical protein